MTNFKISTLLIGLLLILPACSMTAPTSPAIAQATEPASIQQTPTAVPTVLNTETPAPPAINAPIVETPSLINIRFLNELDGWGITSTQIVRTNDGGVTWYNVTPSSIVQTGYSVNTFVLDNEHVWMQVPDMMNYPNAGTLYQTSDAGITWTSSAVPFSSANLIFLDEKNGWVMSDLGAGAGSQGVAVYQTTDGGATWNQTYSNDPNQPNAKKSLPLGGIKSGLTPLNMKTAWVSGVVYSDGNVYLYQTNDGGANWSQVKTLSLPPAAQNVQVSFDAVKFVTAQDAFVTVHIPSDHTQLAVFASNDAGNTWSLMPALIPNGSSTDFLSANEMVIYTGTQFYVSHDAAHTWNTIPANAAFIDTFAMMDFVSTSTGWVITSDTNEHRSLYRTSDGGATWSLVIP